MLLPLPYGGAIVITVTMGLNEQDKGKLSLADEYIPCTYKGKIYELVRIKSYQTDN